MNAEELGLHVLECWFYIARTITELMLSVFTSVSVLQGTINSCSKQPHQEHPNTFPSSKSCDGLIQNGTHSHIKPACNGGG